MVKEPPPTIYTVGHSNLSLDDFLALLRQHAIALVVDVRSSPYCAYSRHFDRQPLERVLVSQGFGYEYLGHRLGGRPDSTAYYDADGHVDYAALSVDKGFQDGLARLLELAGEQRVALLCSEEDPTTCHRRRLIARVLAAQAVPVWHLRADGREQDEAELAQAEDTERHRGHVGSLFADEGDSGWRSVQSVSPRRPPDSSSRP